MFRNFSNKRTLYGVFTGVIVGILLSSLSFMFFANSSKSLEEAKTEVIAKHQQELISREHSINQAFVKEIQESLKKLPEDFQEAIIYPFGNPREDQSGVTNLVTCEIWLDPNKMHGHLLDVMKHEYFHFKQCKMFNGNRKEIFKKYGSDSEIERVADAGALLLNAEYTQYTSNPTFQEIQWAKELLEFKLS